MIEVKVGTYPNGTKYYEFWMGKQLIGKAYKEESGWLAIGNKKHVATEFEVAKQLIDKHLNRCRVELNKWDKLRMQLHSR